MPSKLRPRNLGELLDRTFQLYWGHFLLFVGISALAHLLAFVTQVGFSPCQGLRAPCSGVVMIGMGIGYRIAAMAASIRALKLCWPSTNRFCAAGFSPHAATVLKPAMTALPFFGFSRKKAANPAWCPV